jgi:hypothetical protein
MQALEKIRMSALHPHIPNISLDAEAIKAFNKNGGTLDGLNQSMRGFFVDGEPFSSWASPKIATCLVLIRHLVGSLQEKAVVMVQNNKELIVLNLQLTKSYRVVCLDSGVDMSLRGAMTRMFNESARDGPQILLTTYLLGGEGINLHVNCRVFIAVPLAWNIDKILQAYCRVHRNGSRKPTLFIEIC